jgi:ribosomal protein S18 acetylase RimI-like enzyme
MTPLYTVKIERWTPVPAGVDDDLDRLGGILHACVHAGGSVSFVLPFSHNEAKAFWRDQVLPALNSGGRLVLLARQAGQIVGTVQLDLATPPNQPHRAEVRKLLVHPDARRRGIARCLMTAVEDEAREARRTLLTLDTVTSGPAESLYRSLGYAAIGSIPRYALNFDSSELEATTVMYKELSP